MLQGKNPQQQLQTLYNFAQSQGIDPNAKIFSAEQLRLFGLDVSPKG